MILAIGIAALVLISVNMVFFAALHLRNDTADMVDAASPIDSMATFMKRDLECMVTPTNGTSKVLSGGFRGGNNLNSAGRLERPGGGGNVHRDRRVERHTAPWADIQRVTYELREAPTDNSAGGRDLYRSVMRNCAGGGHARDVTDQLLLSGVESVKFSCYDGAQWDAAWDTTNPTATSIPNLPVAVRVEIQMAGRSDLHPIERWWCRLDAQSRARMQRWLTATTAPATDGNGEMTTSEYSTIQHSMAERLNGAWCRWRWQVELGDESSMLNVECIRELKKAGRCSSLCCGSQSGW